MDAVHCNWHSQNRNKLPLSALVIFLFFDVDAFICRRLDLCVYVEPGAAVKTLLYQKLGTEQSSLMMILVALIKITGC